jgi:acyl-coenzyme A thioesterase PaaI-like protein
MEDDGRALRRKQPNSRNCFVCGLENPVGLHLAFYSTGPGEAACEYLAPERYQGYPGVVHGGIVASMLDEIVGRAAMESDSDRFMMTAKLEIRYRQPIPTGVVLRLVGRLVSRRGRAANATGQILLPDGTVGAEAEALLVELPGLPSQGRSLEDLGWRVYPDEPDAARAATERGTG